MSHEMRTPLHGIIGMLQLAIDTETSAERARQLDMARRSAETLLATIGDILDFSKIEARRMELEPVYFSMRQLITDTLKTLGITAAEKGLTLAFAVSPEVPDRLWGDPLRIRQIVVNLVGNALKFTNRGDVVVRVSCEVMSADRVTIGFEVRDTGVGIDPSRRHLIFDPFAQADSSHSRRYGGSGLGLAIVARLLEAMGGMVTFESEQGKGSTFRFVLPMPCEPVGTAPPPEWESALAGMRVLLIEPNATTRAILAETLRVHGMVPESYATLDGALQPSIRAAYACVVADANILASTPWIPPVPVVRITSPLAPAYHGGVLVTRPVGERELLDAIGVALGVAERTVTYTLERRPEVARPLRVLVVDDNVVNQEFAAEAVRRLGHVVTTLESGAEALDILAKRTFDVILLDMQMPGLDGLEVARRFRGTGTRHAHADRRRHRAHDARRPRPLHRRRLRRGADQTRHAVDARRDHPRSHRHGDAVDDSRRPGGRDPRRRRRQRPPPRPRPRRLRHADPALAGLPPRRHRRPRRRSALPDRAHAQRRHQQLRRPPRDQATARLERAGKAADFTTRRGVAAGAGIRDPPVEERIEAALG